MDGFQNISDVIVIGATNRPDTLDSAILRPGRFDELIYIPLPDLAARLEIFKIATRSMNLHADISLEALARHTEGYSGAEIVQITNGAGMQSIKRSLTDEFMQLEDFDSALKSIKPRISHSTIAAYESFLSNNSLFK